MSNTNVPKAHKNAEVIKAFADGKDIQWQVPDGSGFWYDFDGDSDEGPWVNDIAIWRVKPEGPWYRVALFKYSAQDGTYILVARNEREEESAKGTPTFVRWLTARVSYEP